MWRRLKWIAARTELVVIAGLVIAGFAAVVHEWLHLLLPIVGLGSPAPAPATDIVPAGERFTCTATRVWDGDGPIWCKEGPRVRLADLATRELDDSCRPGHPCPDARGVDARDHLVVILGGSRGTSPQGHILLDPVALECRSRGSGKGRRTDASCALNGRDLTETQIRDGFGARWDYR